MLGGRRGIGCCGRCPISDVCAVSDRGVSGPDGWVPSIGDQCVAAGVPFLFKQWGEYDENGVKVGKKKAGRIVDGRVWDEYPRGNDE